MNNETRLVHAITDHFLETGKSADRQDIANRIGVSASTIGKWLGDAHGVPAGTNFSRAYREGGGRGRELFRPNSDTLRTIILDERRGIARAS